MNQDNNVILVSRYQSATTSEERNDIAIELLENNKKMLQAAVAKYSITYKTKKDKKEIEEDLLQAARIALLDAASSYKLQDFQENQDENEKRPASFTTYAYLLIEREVAKELRVNINHIHFSDHAVRIMSKIKAVDNNGPELPRKELIKTASKELGITEEKVEEYLDYLPFWQIDSLNEPLKEDSSTPLIEQVADSYFPSPDKVLDQKERLMDINEVLLTLSTTQAEIVRKISGLEDGRKWSVEEIARELNISAERVERIKDRAFRRITRPERTEKLGWKERS